MKKEIIDKKILFGVIGFSMIIVVGIGSFFLGKEYFNRYQSDYDARMNAEKIVSVSNQFEEQGKNPVLCPGDISIKALVFKNGNCNGEKLDDFYPKSNFSNSGRGLSLNITSSCDVPDKHFSINYMSVEFEKNKPKSLVVCQNLGSAIIYDL